VGDQLIGWATEQLLEAYHIQWDYWRVDAPPYTSFDQLAFGGGGNMGTRYRNNWELRNQVFACGLPVTILPQSFNSEEPRAYQRVFVREQASLAYYPQGHLAPDLALGLTVDHVPPATRGLGIFLRRDPERTHGIRWLRRDPVRMCKTPQQYFHLAASYRRIITDRLHFAVCGLLAGRQVTLLPNDYHKNRSMHATWLGNLGCDFAESWQRAVLKRYRSRSNQSSTCAA
jgi:exopolysaccharide biosynthesis predicted pyruvyltransferase EpsI